MPEYSRQNQYSQEKNKYIPVRRVGKNYSSQEIKQRIRPRYVTKMYSSQKYLWISVQENNRKNHSSSRQEKTSKFSLSSPPDCLFFPELPLGISTSKSSSQNIQSRMHYCSKLGTTLYSLTCIHLFCPCKYTIQELILVSGKEQKILPRIHMGYSAIEIQCYYQIFQPGHKTRFQVELGDPGQFGSKENQWFLWSLLSKYSSQEVRQNSGQKRFPLNLYKGDSSEENPGVIFSTSQLDQIPSRKNI